MSEYATYLFIFLMHYNPVPRTYRNAFILISSYLLSGTSSAFAYFVVG
uniref:Proton_antipo_M domain-containing protein n=1 Tax=Heterorhabditis bacteriophora TaxID=37862 RepID=A0A1I7XFZ7_HETBA